MTNWTKIKVEYIKNNYLQKSNTVIGERLGVTPSAVSAKLTRLGLPRPQTPKYHNRTYWSQQEEQFLLDNYLTMNNKQLAANINRAYMTIAYKLGRMGLTRPRGLGNSLAMTPERRKQQSEFIKKKYQDGIWSRDLSYTKTQDAIAKFREKTLGKTFFKQKFKERMTGRGNHQYGKRGELAAQFRETHWNWHNGSSFEPYGLGFNKQFKEAIRQRDDYCCVICNKPQEELGYLLCVHHIDYLKANTFRQNCVSLCRNCHIPTHYNRNHWKTFFQSLLKERYGYEYTEDQKLILNYMGAV